MISARGTPISAIDNHSDNILFTLIDIFVFTDFLLVPAVCSDSLGQFEQIHHSEQRTTRSHNHERIHGNGDAWYNAEKRDTRQGRPMPFVLWHASRVTLRNFSVLQPQLWAINIMNGRASMPHWTATTRLR